METIFIPIRLILTGKQAALGEVSPAPCTSLETAYKVSDIVLKYELRGGQWTYAGEYVNIVAIRKRAEERIKSGA